LSVGKHGQAKKYHHYGPFFHDSRDNSDKTHSKVRNPIVQGVEINTEQSYIMCSDFFCE
jgi:hypothetical protein